MTFQTRKETPHIQASILLFEALLILLVFNASSYFGTTVYAKSIDIIGVALTFSLLLWIWVSSRFYFGYSVKDLELTISSVSIRQWTAIFSTVIIFYLLAFTAESIIPTEIRGEITLTRLFYVSVFTLTFGPIFEELLFRGYLFKRSQDIADLKISSKISTPSIFSGLAWGFWHFPSPLIILYFNDSLIKVYENLLAFVIAASVIGIILGEIRSRTKSILPGVLLHLCGNSMYVITMAMRLF